MDLASLGIPPSDLRFFPIVPCRLFDTRNPNGPWGGPAIPGQSYRTFAAWSRCGIPTSARALAANLTSVAPPVPGSLRAYPSGLSFTPSIISNAFNAGNVRAVQGNIGIDPTTGSLRVFAAVPSGSTAHALLDLFGYFAPAPGTPTPAGSSWLFTFRDPENHPVTEYRRDWRTDLGTAVTTLLKDNVYLGNLLVATNTTSSPDGKPLGWVYTSSDHLGSPRLWTDPSRVTLASFRYRAFGLPMDTLSVPGQGPDFAGMEKDVTSGNHYDHARFMGGWIGRFQSPDKLGGKVETPQSWNRYSYTRNNPLKNIDPNGKETVTVLPDVQLRLRTPESERAANIAFGAAIVGVTAPIAGAAIAEAGGLSAAWYSALAVGQQLLNRFGDNVSSNSLPGSLVRTLDRLATSGTTPVELITSQTRSLQAGQALYTTAGENAAFLAKAMQPAGQLLSAKVPLALLEQMQAAGLVTKNIVQSPTGVQATEWAFTRTGAEYILKFFAEMPK